MAWCVQCNRKIKNKEFPRCWDCRISNYNKEKKVAKKPKSNKDMFKNQETATEEEKEEEVEEETETSDDEDTE